MKLSYPTSIDARHSIMNYSRRANIKTDDVACYVLQKWVENYRSQKFAVFQVSSSKLIA